MNLSNMAHEWQEALIDEPDFLKQENWIAQAE